MSHRPRPGPIRVILMPGNDTTVMRRFVKNLVVPKTNGRAKKLRSGKQERWIPQQIVKSWRDTPSAQRMKQNCVRIGRFIAVVFVEQFTSLSIGVQKSVKFGAQNFNLPVVQQANAGEITVFRVKLDL